MRTVSIISIVYGALGLLWAAVISLLVRVQSAIFSNFPWPDEVIEVMDMPAVLDTVYGALGAIFPWIILVAALYIISGILQLTGKKSFKNIAYAAAILNILWYLAYCIIIMVEVVPVLNQIELFPKNLMGIMVLFSMLINAIFYCGYAVFLLIYLAREGKSWDTIETGYTS